MKISLGSVRLYRWTYRLAAGVAVFGLGGCSTDVRTTLVTGVQDATVGLVTTLINAFFTGLLPNSTATTTATTAQATFEELVRWLA